MTAASYATTSVLALEIGDVYYDLGMLEQIAYEGCELSDKAHTDWHQLHEALPHLRDIADSSPTVGHLFD